MTIPALELFRSAPRYLTARAFGERVPGLLSGPLAPMRLVNRKDPVPLGPGWGRVRPLLSGICGSDLATIGGKSSFYFSPLVSLPFVPGHEVVGELLDDVDDLPAGTRIALQPVLSCLARGLDPCPNCAAGLTGRCDRVTTGHVSAGLQTGYCADTGGGWSRMFVAHRSQLHPVPDELPDRKAVLVEPLACAIHTALRANVEPNANVLVIGAGTIGILALLALKELTPAGRVTVVAKHGKQREWAGAFGATEVVEPKEATNSVRRSSHAMKLRPERGAPYLLGGADVAIDCVGSRASLDLALRTVKAGGRVVVERHPGLRRRPHAALVPRARARRCLHRRGRARERRVPPRVRPRDRARPREPDRGDRRSHLSAPPLARGHRPRLRGGPARNPPRRVRPEE